MPASEAADRVWRAVEQSGEVGMRGIDIREATNLTRSQFESGKAHARDYRCNEENKCFLYDGDVYAVTKNPGRSAQAIAFKAQSIDRQLIRLHKSVCAPIASDDINDAAFRYLKSQVEAIMQNLAILRESGYSIHSIRAREAAKDSEDDQSTMAERG